MAFGVTNTILYPNPALIGRNIPANISTGGPAGVSGSETDLTVGAAATTNSAIKDLGTTAKNFRALVYLDTLAGAATLEVKLQVSSSATFATDIVTLDEKFMNAVVSANNTICFNLFGVDGIVAGHQYVRIQFVTGAGTSAVADIIYWAQ